MTLRLDRDSYKELGAWYRQPGFWVIALYRVGAWIRDNVSSPILYLPLLTCYWFVKQPLRFLLHVDIAARARIGAGVCLPHPFSIIIGDGATVGENCTIFHDVTIGRGPLSGMPSIADHVVLFPGVRVLGGCSIGMRTEVGANCVVMKDVPEWSIVMPATQRVLPQALVRSAKDKVEPVAAIRQIAP